MPIGKRARAPALLFAALLAATLARTREIGLVGHDAWPLILSSRVESAADLAGLATEPLMDGLYPGRFYRPLVAASFALDEALFGFEPLGYQVSNALLFAGWCAALLALARRLLSDAAPAAAWAAALGFALHPSVFEVVPAPARRADLLCGLFATLSLARLAARDAPLRARAGWQSALFALLAMLSKESGLLVPVAAGAAARLARAPAPPAAWLLPQAAALGAALGARALVLGGLGGHAPVSPAGWLAALGPTLAQLAGAWWPQPLLAALAAAAAAVCAGPAAARCAALRGGALGLVWSACFAAAAAAAGRVEPWYALLPGAGLCLALAALAAEALQAWRQRAGGARRRAAALSLALCCALLFGPARGPGLLRDQPEWREATRAAERYLAQLERELAADPGRRALEAAPPPRWIAAPAGAQGPRGAAVLAEYSVEAWLALHHPGVRISFRGP